MGERPPTDAVPVLPVADLMRAMAWYERMGFSVDALYAELGYALLSFQGTEVHLNEEPEMAAGPSFSGVFMRVAGADLVDAIHAQWTALGAPELAPPIDQGFGIREFATEDPDGNLWRIGARIGSVAPSPASSPPPPSSSEPPPAGPSFDPGDHGDVWIDEFAAAAADPEVAESVSHAMAEELAAEPPAPAGAPVDAPVDGSPGTHDSAWYELVTEGRRCAGCGLLNGELQARAIGAEIRDVVHAFGDVLRVADDDQLRARPFPTSWSALEYGVHVRDVLNVFAERIMRTLREFDPDLPWWDQEAAIADGMANESDANAVADDLGRNASVLSQVLREVAEDDWARPARRGGTDRFTIETLARFALHEAVHHKADAERALATAASN